MTPEEKFKKKLWFVLQKIKEKSHYCQCHTSIPRDIYDPIPGKSTSDSCPSSKEEWLVLVELESQAAIKLTGDLYDENEEYFDTIEIVQPKFDEIYKEKESEARAAKQSKSISPIPLEITLKQSASSGGGGMEKTLKPKVRLKSAKIKYDDQAARLYVGDQKCQMPPYRNEHSLCRAMFGYKVNEPVDWSEIYEKINESEPELPEPCSRMIWDAMNALNKRVKKDINTDDKLFTWQGKTIKRNY